MAAQEVLGMLLMAAAGVAVSLSVILSAVLKKLGLPYFALWGTACFCLGFVLLALTWRKGFLADLSRYKLKWVVFRGAAGTIQLLLVLLAVRVGAPFGDVSALQSSNVVVAALLGRAVLGEKLLSLHIAALCLMVLGALLVSKVGTLVGAADDASDVPWLGYAAALSAGVVAGAQFLAARKMQGVNPLVLTCSAALQESVAFWFVAISGISGEPLLGPVSAQPFLACLFCFIMMLLLLLASSSLNAGAQLCPVAMSSTVFTSVNMSLNYAAQVLLDREMPQMLSLLGAALMLSAVSLMAFARWLHAVPPGKDFAAGQHENTSFENAPNASSVEVVQANEDEDTESLVSFIAAEFSGLDLKGVSTVRHRHANASTIVSASRVIGVVGV